MKPELKSNSSQVTQELKPLSTRQASFEEIERWARDDSYLLDRATLEGIRQASAQHSVKVQLIAMALARRQVTVIERFTEKIATVENILFADDRLKHMQTGHLIQIFDVLTKRQTQIVANFTRVVLDPKQQPNIDDNALRSCLEDPTRRPEISLADDAQRRVFEGIQKLADTIGKKERGLVPPPPKVQ